jgi:Spy/CpxP family protein refolding chaperone
MNRRLWSGGLALAGWMMLGVAGAGCGSSATPAAAATPGVPDVSPAGTVATEDDDSTSADLKAHHRHHHHGGFAMFVLMAADTVGATPEQQAAIDRIKADLHAKMAPAHEAEKALLTTLADGVAAGNVDMAKVDAAVTGVAAAAGQVHGATADAINQLHAVLRPEQRAALVDKVEAHWLLWKNANGDEATAHEHEEGGRIAHIQKELGLSADQVEKIRAGFAAQMSAVTAAQGKFNAGEADAHMKAFGAAFTADQFDARSLTSADGTNAHMATWGATRMARFYETVSPTLTPEQRTKLAAMIREHATHQHGHEGT